jgi:aryl-alcohol dehydrogenase-like predicted oxidoreductase
MRSVSRFVLLLFLSAEADSTPTQFLDTLYESGCRFWDTANVYGDSEELLGKW